MDVKEEELQELYSWVDSIPLSRPKRNIARDFSDGVLLAEVGSPGLRGCRLAQGAHGWLAACPPT